MMRKLIHWGPSARAWHDSGLDLPVLDAAADASQQRWCIVAGGLALILSRISPTQRAARFRCTHALYEHVRGRLRDGQAVTPSLDLLSEVLHETAEIADRLTRNCLKAVFQAGVGGPQDGLAAANDSRLSCGAGAPTTSRRSAPAGTR